MTPPAPPEFADLDGAALERLLDVSVPAAFRDGTLENLRILQGHARILAAALAEAGAASPPPGPLAGADDGFEP